MKNDSLYGPPKEMFNKKPKSRQKKERMEKRDAEYISDDDFKLNENDDGEDLAMLRKYEVNKMKYYFAIVYCNSVKTASRLVEENQGIEFELTNIKLSMSCVDDEL